jgi:tripartite ATP-independent transporter DctP family solute receptor
MNLNTAPTQHEGGHKRRRNVDHGTLITRRAALGGLAAAGLAAPARAAPLMLKLATADTTNDTSYEVGQRWGAEINKRTGGKYDVQMFVNGALGSTVNLANSLSTGIIDCAILTSGYLESIVPSVQVIDLPFVFKDEATAERLLDGAVGTQLFTDMEKRGIKGLAWGWYGWRQIEITDRAIRTPDDMHGLKIRIQPGPVFAAAFRALGAVPVSLDGGEVYLGLSQGTVSAVEFPLPTAVTFKVYEVTKNLSLTKHVYNAGALMVSQTRWAQLTPEDQKAFQDAATAVLPFWRTTVAKRSEDALTFLQGHGMKVQAVDFDAFQQKMTAVYKQFSPRYPELFRMITEAHA